ncbi:MAG: ATP-binding cassette domain-containing protein [Polyangiaceae bacterium]
MTDPREPESEVKSTPKRLVVEKIRVDRGGKCIVREIDVSANAGEVVGVLGPSGAGKSTLFRAIVGETQATSGRVFLDGEDMTARPLWQRARAGFGYVPQSASVLWDLTVRQNLDTFEKVANGEIGDAKKSAERVGLGERLDVRAGELSAGERRRLECARALVRKPKVLICDEPFSGVDPIGAARLGELLRDVASEGTAVLVADHHVEEALAICSRALLLLDGSVAVDATPEEFLEDPLVRGRYLGTFRRSIPPQ